MATENKGWQTVMETKRKSGFVLNEYIYIFEYLINCANLNALQISSTKAWFAVITKLLLPNIDGLHQIVEVYWKIIYIENHNDRFLALFSFRQLFSVWIFSRNHNVIDIKWKRNPLKQ